MQNVVVLVVDVVRLDVTVAVVLVAVVVVSGVAQETPHRSPHQSCVRPRSTHLYIHITGQDVVEVALRVVVFVSTEVEVVGAVLVLDVADDVLLVVYPVVDVSETVKVTNETGGALHTFGSGIKKQEP